MTETREEWAKLGVRNEKDFERHISQTIHDKETQVYQAHRNNRDVYYNKRTNTFVAIDPKHPDKGTCYLPKEGEKQFEKSFNKDKDITERINQQNPDRKIPEPEIKTGGIDAVYAQEKNQDKSQGKTEIDTKEQERRKVLERLQRQNKEKDNDRGR